MQQLSRDHAPVNSRQGSQQGSTVEGEGGCRPQAPRPAGRLPAEQILCRPDRQPAHHRRTVTGVELPLLHQLHRLWEGLGQCEQRDNVEATETLWNPREDNLPHTVHLSGHELRNCPRRPAVWKFRGEDWHSAGVPAFTVPLSPGHLLDHEDNYSKYKQRYTVDTLDAARRPRLCWWPGAPVTQSQPDAGQDHSPGDHISRDRAQDQQEEDPADEDEYNCQRTSHSWRRVHQGDGVFRLPEKRGWPTERHRPRRHSQNRQGKSSFRHAQKHLDIWRNQHENQTPHLQLQCEVSPAIRMRRGGQHRRYNKISRHLQHLSEAHLQNPMAREDPKWRSMGTSGTGTSGQADIAEEVGLDRTHPQVASIQHLTPSPDLETSGEERERPA